MSEKAKVSDKMTAGIVGGGSNAFVAEPPYIMMDAECYGPDGFRWRDHMDHNVVVNQGRNLIMNRLLGSWTSYSQGCLLFLHSATTATNNVWSQISGSQVVSYGASIPQITFSTQDTAASNTGSAPYMTATASYGFTASTQTVSGAGILFYTSASGGTNLASADERLYCYGTFANSRQVQSADTLNVTVSVSFA